MRETYRNIEIAITVEQRIQHVPEPMEWVDLILRVYPSGGWSKNEAAAAITKHFQISGDAKFSDFTEANTAKLFAHYVFHDSMDEVTYWLDEWMQKEYKSVIEWYFQSKIYNY